MKISELVALKNEILGLNSNAISTTSNQHLENLQIIVNKFNIPLIEQIDLCRKSITEIELAEQKLNSNLTEVIKKLDHQIYELTKTFNTNGYIVNGLPWTCDSTVEAERSIRFETVDDITKTKVLSRIQTLTSPKIATLEIGPGDGAWTHFLVAADPLYLLDVHQEFLDSTSNKFPSQYHRRLRRYLTGTNNDRASQCDTSMLPQEQFGFIFAWDVFTFFPETGLKEYLENCFNLLKPGGAIIFNYNNCDTIEGARYAEIGFKSWMPMTTLTKIYKSIGFNLVNHHEDPMHCWIELKKPGNLMTVKTHQALGEIKQINT